MSFSSPSSAILLCLPPLMSEHLIAFISPFCKQKVHGGQREHQFKSLVCHGNNWSRLGWGLSTPCTSPSLPIAFSDLQVFSECFAILPDSGHGTVWILKGCVPSVRWLGVINFLRQEASLRVFRSLGVNLTRIYDQGFPALFVPWLPSGKLCSII